MRGTVRLFVARNALCALALLVPLMGSAIGAETRSGAGVTPPETASPLIVGSADIVCTPSGFGQLARCYSIADQDRCEETEPVRGRAMQDSGLPTQRARPCTVQH
jgi:hypothetical protein